MKHTMTTTLLTCAISALVANSAMAAETTGMETETKVQMEAAAAAETNAQDQAGELKPDSSWAEEQQTARIENPIYELTPAQLSEMLVVDAEGKETGRVSAVVRSKTDEGFQAVISSGGILGIGAKKIAVPLDQISLQDNQLHLDTDMKTLKAEQEFTAEGFVALPADRPVSEFAVIELLPKEPTAAGGKPTEEEKPATTETSQ